MYWQASAFKTDCQPQYSLKTILSDGVCKITSPVAELELARDPARFKKLIVQRDGENADILAYERWNIEVMRANTCMDLLFIALYWSTYVLFASRRRGWVSRCVIAGVSIAGISDAIENTRILQSLHAVRMGLPSQNLPFIVSAVKWSFFGLASLLLGMIVLKAKGVSERESSEKRFLEVAISIFFLASGVLTWLGIVKVPVLGLSIAFLSIALLMSIWRYFPLHPFDWTKLLEWIEYFYLIRFQVLASVLLAIVIPAGYFAAPSIFIGLFDARGLTSFTLVVWMALQLAWTVMITSRLILVYGPERFFGIRGLQSDDARKNPMKDGEVQRRRGDATYSQLGLFGVLAAPCAVMLCCGTDLAWYQKAIGIGVAAILAVGFLCLTAALHYRIERSDAAWTAARIFPTFGFLGWHQGYSRWKAWKIVDVLLDRLPERLRAGLVRKGQLRSGHEVATIALLLQLGIYVAIGFGLRPDLTLPEHQPAALFFALFLLILLTWIFSGTAFFLDAVRLPVLSTLLICSLLSGAIARTDHQFKIFSSILPSTTNVSPRNVVRKWACARKKPSNAPVIIVATAGGGIRAAAWTTQVLTGLEEESRAKGCPANLTSSLLAISSVSGGSVGSMFFLAGYDSNTGEFRSDQDAIRSIRFNASRSTLSAVGWGFLYPDAARTLPLLGMFIPQFVDRGWALENAWISGWPDPPNISNWRADVAAGHRPAAIFNATAAESGDRFLIASTDLSDIVLGDGPDTLEDSKTIRFSTKFQGYDVPVATAARLSATFPYVSPEAQASDGPKRARVHIGDGGYYDNSGVLSALEWLEQASSELKGHPVRVLLIDSEPGTPQGGERWSWQRQIVSPIDTLLNVRSASQELRSKIELGVGMRLLNSQPDLGIDVKSIPFLFATPLPAPLSWHLTPEQRLSIDENWQANKGARKEVLKFLGCSVENN
jgi:hypothetical protein